MTTKNIRVLIAAYVLLAAAASAPFWIGRVAGLAGWKNETPIALSEFGPEIEKFAVSSNGQALAFEKKDGAWQVNGKPADQDAIKTFFEALRTTSVGRIVSRNKENHAAYGVHEADTYALHLEEGDRSLNLLIGNIVPGQSAYYLRTTSDDTVYEATGTLRQISTRPESNWIPKPAEEGTTSSQSTP